MRCDGIPLADDQIGIQFADRPEQGVIPIGGGWLKAIHAGAHALLDIGIAGGKAMAKQRENRKIDPICSMGIGRVDR